MILSDGLYNFLKVLGKTIEGFIKQCKNKEVLHVSARGFPEQSSTLMMMRSGPNSSSKTKSQYGHQSLAMLELLLFP